MDAITSKVIEILAKKAKTQPENLTPETSLNELGIDSLDTVETVFELEEQFNITIPDTPEIKNRLSSFGTVREVAKIVESLLEPASQL